MLDTTKRYTVVTARGWAQFNDARCANGHAALNRGTIWLTKHIVEAGAGWITVEIGARPLHSHA